MTVKLIALTWDNSRQEADLAFDDATDFINSASGFETAVTISLFTWARNDQADVATDGQPFGWWGDTYSEPEGDRIGSRLHLLRRAKVNPETLQRAKGYALEALAWMTQDGVAKTVSAEVERYTAGGAVDAIAMKISITRLQGGKWTGIWEIHLDGL